MPTTIGDTPISFHCSRCDKPLLEKNHPERIWIKKKKVGQTDRRVHFGRGKVCCPLQLVLLKLPSGHDGVRGIILYFLLKSFSPVYCNKDE